MVNKRGRLAGSVVRDNIVELLFFMGTAHGYGLAKNYVTAFGKPISTRLIYYHLRKGKELGVFQDKGIERVEGNYSWGSAVERKVYALGPKAEPKGTESVRKKLNL